MSLAPEWAPVLRAVKCVVFDFDGVLVDSNAVKRDAYFQVFAGVDGARPEVAAALVERRDGDRFQVIDRIIERLEHAGRLPVAERAAAIQRYAAAYNRLCEEYAATCRAIPGATDGLPRLAEHFPLYVNSDTPREPLRRVVGRRGWDGYFRDVLGRPDTKAANLASILRRESLPGAGALFVGDSARDLRAARECGTHFVAVRNDYNDFPLDGLLVVGDLHALAQALTGAQAQRRSS